MCCTGRSRLSGYFEKLLQERSYLYGWEEMQGKILARLAEFEAKDSK
jgi:hypothetical protein